ncbi:hypothetical protein EUGRSUZ_G00828 [Eucalyptus grandis]|uniref:Uncharacterized protein n=2 Tax=Eucalyptus grandis TaxID=71139 RepID=A0ACC3K239_EUCGR|nr:hypothetical protein EUGRSUZ_G00828 [Eucalyptus grandis]
MEFDQVCKVHGSSHAHSLVKSLERDRSSNCSSRDFPGKLKKQGLRRALEPASKFVLDYPFSKIAVKLIHLKKINVVRFS